MTLSPTDLPALSRDARPIRLRPGELACADCGVPVPDEGQGPRIERDGFPQGAGARPVRPQPSAMVRTTFLLCTDCSARAELAARITRANPSLRAARGPGLDGLTGDALTGLAVLHPERPLGVTDRDAQRLLGGDAAYLAELHTQLAGPGGLAPWSARFAPVVSAPPGAANPYPWAHVAPGVVARLREGQARLLAAAVAEHAPDVRLSVPEPVERGIPVPGGCLFCGIPAVTVSAAEVARSGAVGWARRKAWRAVAISGDSLGGWARSQPLSGHLCAPCADAADRTGSTGARGMERALAVELEASGRTSAANRVRTEETEGLVGWAILALRGAAPNETPWQHVRFAVEPS